MKLSIVIPVFQAEHSIEGVVHELLVDPYLKTLKWELIMVDDFSQDESWNIIKQLSDKHKQVLGICLHKNCGQHTATFVGLKEAKGKYLLTLDDDGEHPIKEIPKMIEEIEKRMQRKLVEKPIFTLLWEVI